MAEECGSSLKSGGKKKKRKKALKLCAETEQIFALEFRREPRGGPDTQRLFKQQSRGRVGAGTGQVGDVAGRGRPGVQWA